MQETAHSSEMMRPDGKGRLPPWTWAILASAGAWLTLFLAIPASAQNFPLGDDWAFAHGAIWFAHGSGIHYSRWASMPELGQWLWSAPFLSITELSHVALRVSVIVLSWLGLAAFYDLLRREEIPARRAALAACVLALDPLFFVSQGTYMTDVPALSFGLLALSFYGRALAGKDWRWLGAAVLLAMLAVTTRQTMLAVPAVAGLLLLRDPELRWKPVWLAGVVLPAVVCLYTSWWFSHRPDILPMHLSFDVKEVAFRPFLAIHLCGLVVLPLCLLAPLPGNRRLVWVCLAVMLIAAGVAYGFAKALPFGGLFPYCTGMLSPWGTFSDGLVVGHRDVLLTPAWRILLTVLGCLGAARILAAVAELIHARIFPGMLLLFTLAQFLIMLTLPGVMDRYLEVLFPGAILLVLTRSARGPGSRWFAAAAGAGWYGLIAIALLHDWMAWNSVRWELGRQIIARPMVQPEDVEGGFEWNGWYGCADPAKPLARADAARANVSDGSLALPFTRMFFPQVTGNFALAFTPPANSVVVASLPYSQWLPPAKKDFWLVRAAWGQPSP